MISQMISKSQTLTKLLENPLPTTPGRGTVSKMGSTRRISSDPCAQLRELEQLQLLLRAMEVSAKPAETDCSRSQPLRQRPVVEQNAHIQKHAFSRSLPRIVEQHPEPVQAIAATKQHSHAAERRGPPGIASFQGLPPPAPEDAKRALSGVSSKPGASRYRSFSDNRPPSLLASAKSGKVRVSSINSQLAAFCEEERDRARARPLSSKSPKVLVTPAGSIWLALGVLFLTVFFFLARLFTALTFCMRKREHTPAGSTAEHRTMATQHRPKDKHAAGKSATAPRADLTFDEFRNVQSKNQSEETIAAAPRTSRFARRAIRPPEASLYNFSRTQPDQPKRHHNSTPKVTNMTVFV